MAPRAANAGESRGGLDRRPLTAGEWRGLHPGLAGALRDAGLQPAIVARVHPAARLAAVWRGGAPVLARPSTIWWPRAPADLSAPGFERGMAVLQHELQHVLDYGTGRLTAIGYLSRPANWRYGWPRDRRVGWDRLGAEQRASMAEQLWLIDNGFAPDEDRAVLEAAIPWAGPASRP